MTTTHFTQAEKLTHELTESIHRLNDLLELTPIDDTNRRLLEICLSMNQKSILKAITLINNPPRQVA